MSTNINELIKEDILQDLSEDERKVALTILEQYSKFGYSEVHNKLQSEDYEEIPVDIHTFLHDERYLGKGLIDEEGRFSLFEYWEELFDKIYNDNLSHPNFNILALTGAIGIGKSTEAVILGIYELYKMLCLKNPYTHYGLMPTDLITFAVLNITKDAAEGVAWNKLQSLIQTSQWFLEHGTISKGTNPEWRPPKGIELIYGSQPRHIIGRAVFWAFLDEVSFQPNKDVNEQKRKAKEMVNTALRRMQSRFQHGEYNPTILCIASSKRTDQSYMETFIAEKKRNDAKNTLVVDEPQWVIRPDKVSKKWFKVAVGNKFLDSQVLPLTTTEQELQILRDRGYTIIDVPFGYYNEFIDDVNDALNEIAGISTTNSNKFLNGPKLAAIKTDKYQNMFINEIITVGDDPEDRTQYYNYIDLKRVPTDYYTKPLYIHMDLSESGDKTGIAGVWVVGKQPPSPDKPEAKDLRYRLAFSVSIKAPKGYSIDFEKNRNLIYWLKERGFNIKMVTTDTFQSFDTGQMLKKKGYNYEVLSVDRTTKVEGNKYVCIPYQSLRTTIYEKRLEMYQNVNLTEELLNLEKDQTSGKVDHPPRGCFTGDTKVKLVDGRSVSFEDLVDEYNNGKINYVYSFNHNNKKIEPKKILKAWKTADNQPLIKLTLDNGKEIKCTYNHQFMLRTGDYIEAKDLIPGDSLMPLYTKYPSKGALKEYRMYYEPFEDKWHFEHRQFAQEILDEKYLVHHKDCNKNNNNPDNLVWCSKTMHKKIHDKYQTGARSEEARNKKSKSIKKWHSDNKSKDVYRERSEKTRQSLYSYHLAKKGYIPALEKEKRIKEIETIFGVDYSKLSHKEKDSLGVKYSRIKDPTIQKNISKIVSNNHKKGKYINAKKALACNNQKNKFLKQLFPTIDKELFNELFGFSYDSLPSTKKPVYTNRYRQKLYDLKNHKVVSIEFISERADVYDIEVEDNHNFALAAGIFVHNSKDVADALCGSLYTASKFADEYAYRYGEDLEMAVTVGKNELSRKEQEKKMVQDMDEVNRMIAEQFGSTLEDKPRKWYPSDIISW